MSYVRFSPSAGLLAKMQSCGCVALLVCELGFTSTEDRLATMCVSGNLGNTLHVLIIPCPFLLLFNTRLQAKSQRVEVTILSHTGSGLADRRLLET